MQDEPESTDAANPSKSQLQAQAPTDTKFSKGKSGNPGGRPKGALSKTTKFRQLLSASLQEKAVKVIKQVIKQAENGDIDSQKMVVSMIQPFLKAEAGAADSGPKDRRPVVQINVNPAAPAPKQITARVVDAKVVK